MLLLDPEMPSVLFTGLTASEPLLVSPSRCQILTSSIQRSPRSRRLVPIDNFNGDRANSAQGRPFSTPFTPESAIADWHARCFIGFQPGKGEHQNRCNPHGDDTPVSSLAAWDGSIIGDGTQPAVAGGVEGDRC